MTTHNQTRSLGHQTGLAGRLFNRLLTRRFAEAGIDMTAEQWGVVLTLMHHPAMTQGELCEHLYLEKSTVSRSIAGLEKRGWIQSNKQGRQKYISLTEQAQQIAQQCSEIAASVLRDAQQGLDPQQLQQSHELLGNVIKNLRRHNDA